MQSRTTIKSAMFYSVEPTKITPFVEIDPEKGLLNFRGRSSPQSSINFFHPILDSIRKNFSNRKENVVANFAFEYFNTSTSKCLFDILRELNKIDQRGNPVQVNWFYEDWDDDMRETGEDYEDLIGMRFNYIEVESEY